MTSHKNERYTRHQKPTRVLKKVMQEDYRQNGSKENTIRAKDDCCPGETTSTRGEEDTGIGPTGRGNIGTKRTKRQRKRAIQASKTTVSFLPPSRSPNYTPRNQTENRTTARGRAHGLGSNYGSPRFELVLCRTIYHFVCSFIYTQL